MQRGRFLILIGILLAVTAVGLLLLISGDDEPKEPADVQQPIVEAQPTQPPPTPEPKELALVARQRIPRGTLLVTGTVALNEWISVESWPAGWLTQDALISFDQVEGRIARSDIPRGTLLMADMLTDQAGDLASTGSDAALLIPPDRVGVAIPVDHISSVGWSLRRGDHVDVLVSFLMIDLDEEFQTELPNRAAPLIGIESGTVAEGATVVQGVYGRIEQDPFGQPINVIPSEAHQRPRLVSQVTVRDAQVLNVGPWGELFRASAQTRVTFPTPTGDEEQEGGPEGEPAAGPEEGEGTVVPQQVEILLEEGQRLTEEEVLREYLNVSIRQPLLLAVSPQDALVLKWAGEAGAAMHVVLRSYEDAGVGLPDTEPVTLQYMVDRFNLALPAGLPYGAEPAPRILERIFLGLPDRLWNPWSAQPAGTESPPR